MKIIFPHYIVRIYSLLFFALFAANASAQSCNDSASIITLSSVRNFYVYDQLTGRLGNRIYSGAIFENGDTSALLFCHNDRGEMQWAKSFRNDLLPRSFFEKAYELRDGSLIVTGKIMDVNGLIEYLLVAKFDAAGNYQWHRLYKPSLLSYPEDRMHALQITEDDSGMLYFSFFHTTYNFSAVASLDPNGNLNWSRSFRRGNITIWQLGIAFIPAGFKGDTLLLTGISTRDQFSLKLNKNTGELFSVNQVSLGTALPGASFELANPMGGFNLPNGHLLTVTRIHWALPREYVFVEWDDHLNFVKAFTLDMTSIIGLSVLFSFTVLPDGTLVIATPFAKNPPTPVLDKVYIAGFDMDQQQVFQKKVLLRRSDYRLHRSNDNCIVGVDQNGQLMVTPTFSAAGQTSLDIYKFTPNSAQACVRTEDTLFTKISPLALQQPAFSFDEILTDVLEEVASNVTVRDEVFTRQVVCETKNFCDFVSIAGPVNICAENSPAIFTVTKNLSCSRKINWQFDPYLADSVKHVNDSTIHIFFSKGGQGQVIASLEGCNLADTIDFQVRKVNPPLSHIANNISLCIGQNDTLRAGLGYASYQWQNGSNEVDMVASSPGVYWVKVTDGIGCQSTDTVTVTALHDRPINFIAPDTSVCRFNTIELKPHGDFISYRWSTGETTPTIKISEQGIYTISVTDRYNCIGSGQVTIVEKDCKNLIFFPNAFSPNGDGNNDSFKPVVSGNIVNYRLEIFNRWGQKIFESSNPAAGWNGRKGSMLQEPGTYIWQASIEFAGEDRRILKGVILLVP
jgi:gliding motility-associated-like protein